PASGVLAGSGYVRSRALLARAQRGSAEVRLSAVWRWAATVHRQPVRAHRVAARRGHAGAAVSFPTGAAAARRAVGTHYASTALRYADDHQTPDPLRSGLVAAGSAMSP